MGRPAAAVPLTARIRPETKEALEAFVEKMRADDPTYTRTDAVETALRAFLSPADPDTLERLAACERRVQELEA